MLDYFQVLGSTRVLYIIETVNQFKENLRAGEMSVLKWKNVDFDRKIIKLVETRVEGEEKRPKTKG